MVQTLKYTLQATLHFWCLIFNAEQSLLLFTEPSEVTHIQTHVWTHTCVGALNRRCAFCLTDRWKLDQCVFLCIPSAKVHPLHLCIFLPSNCVRGSLWMCGRETASPGLHHDVFNVWLMTNKTMIQMYLISLCVTGFSNIRFVKHKKHTHRKSDVMHSSTAPTYNSEYFYILLLYTNALLSRPL